MVIIVFEVVLMSIFGERLSQLKEESGMMQKELAAELEINVPNLSYYMKGREPNYDTLCKLADYFKVTTDYLTGHSNYRNPEAEALTQSIQTQSNVEVANTRRQAEISNSYVKINQILNAIASLETDDNKLDYVWEMIALWLEGFENYVEFLRLNKRPYYPLDEAKKAMDTLSRAQKKAANGVGKMLRELVTDDNADQAMKDRVIIKSTLGILDPQNHNHNDE